MICEHCGGDRVYWRCNNKETNTTKYKCLDCGAILVKPPTDTPILTDKEKEELREKMDAIKKEAKSRGGIECCRRNKSKRPHNEKHLYKARGDKRIIYKQVNNKTTYYGTYPKKEAIKIRNKLMKRNWDINQLERIKEEVLG